MEEYYKCSECGAVGNWEDWFIIDKHYVICIKCRARKQVDSITQ